MIRRRLLTRCIFNALTMRKEKHNERKWNLQLFAEEDDFILPDDDFDSAEPEADEIEVEETTPEPVPEPYKAQSEV